jgi:predicted CXXCH cytochrome family protein
MNPCPKKVFLLSLPLLLFPAIAIATTLTVNSGGGADYTAIQPAINASVSGGEVHVASGTYFENISTAKAISLLGGYNASDWSRDPAANVTVIDANGAGSAVKTTANAVIDGFTIKGSAATGIVAGVYVRSCSPTITNNKVTLNGRHGIFVEGSSSPVIENNLVAANAYNGIYCYTFVAGGSPVIYNNTIDGNLNGIRLYGYAAVIKNNIITGSSGYGIEDNLLPVPTVDYNDLYSNASGNYFGVSPGSHDKSVDPLYAGGGDYHLQVSPVVSQCIDAGVYVGLPYYNLPDMGAYESLVAQAAPWPPEGLMATPLSAMVKLTWAPNKEPNIAGYKVSYGNVPGSYAYTVDAGSATTLDVRSLINDASYFFAVRAYNTLSNTSDYSTEISATPTAGTHELPHYNYAAFYGGGDCTDCHYADTGSGELLPQGFDYRYSSGLCFSCHNTAGQAYSKTLTSNSHPVFVSATTGGNNIPAYGNITGRFSNRMGDHLKGAGNVIVCSTCHNVMEKTEDPGRTWEMTTQTYQDYWKTMALQRGGWNWYGYLAPVVYTSPTLMAAPTYTKARAAYAVPRTDLYDYDPEAGKITFNYSFFDYAYVTLYYPYLRVNNSDNMMCLDCHNTGTHRLANCLTCHENHNYQNRHGIRRSVKTPANGIKTVVFSRITGVNSFADGNDVYDGICEVCHTNTKYYRNDGTGFTNHSGGVNHSRKNCTSCHTHVSGFSKY